MSPPPDSPAGRDERVNDAVAEYLEAAEAGRAPGREEFLARHPDLADELRAFLDDRDRFAHAAGRLGGPALSPAKALTLASPAGPAAGAPPGGAGRSFGDYELLEELGRGGMGVVYKARQVSLNRTVALKMILVGQLADEPDVQRFLCEARTAAGLQHPGIVAIHEVGAHDGRHYFSMDYVEGRSLADLVRDHPLPPAQAARYVRHIAEAVHHAHQQGVLHRDLKPSNVLIDGSDQPHVTDFGLAKRLGEDAGLTATGAVVGTPSYMPPEQASGKRAPLGPAADVYALGAVLYELVVGRPPFTAATPMDTLLQVLGEEPVPPRRLQPKLPRDLETICLKCLQKEPKKRYPTALALAEDLGRFLAGKPIQARPVGRAERVVKWVRRRPVVAGLLAAVLAVAVLGFGLVTWQWRATVTARQATEKQLDRTEMARYASQVSEARHAIEDRELAQARNLLDDCRWDLRGWEWRYLRRQCRPGRELSRSRRVGGWGYTRGYVLCWSPDGRHLAGATDGGVMVWDAHGEYIRSTGRKPEDITSLALSPDGIRLACGGAHGSLTVRDWQTDELILTLKGHAGPVNGVCFSPDGRRLASASFDKTVTVWDAHSGQELLSLQGHTDSVSGVCFSPDGQRLATASGETVKVWDAQTGREVLSLRGHTLQVKDVSFSPDGTRLASATEWDLRNNNDRSGEVKVWDARTGQETLAIPGAGGCLAFSPDGQRLASTDTDGRPKVWDVRTGQQLLSGEELFPQFVDRVTGVAFSPDGQRLASLDRDGVKVWDARTNQHALSLQGHADAVVRVAFSPDGERLAGASKEAVKVWDARTGEETLSLPEAGAWLAFSPDGQRLAGAAADGRVQVWDVRTGQQMLSVGELFPGVRPDVTSVAFSPDGQRLACFVKLYESDSDWSYQEQVWDLRTGQEASSKVLATSQRGLGSAAFTPDGRLVAYVDTSARAEGLPPTGIVVWDLQAGRIRTLKANIPISNGHPDASLAFSPDGRRLASFSPDGTVKVWEWQTGQEAITLQKVAGPRIPPHHPIASVAFSPDGRRLAGAGWSDRDKKGEVRVWDLQTGLAVLSLQQGAKDVTDVAFSPDGRRLASVSGKEIKVWDAQPDPGPFVVDARGLWTDVERFGFSPDSQRIVVKDPSGQRSTRTWDVITGREVLSCTDPLPPSAQPLPPTPPGGVTQRMDPAEVNRGPTQPAPPEPPVARSPDGQRVASARGDKVQVRWARDTTPEALERQQQEDFRDGAAWHYQQAADAEKAGQWFAAAFHLSRLVEVEPARAKVYARRAHAYTQLGQAQQAAADLAKAKELEARH
jgi:WD40 repeat protein/predicted Ser/Thr protein kinase